jgi:hypothetical protein
MMRPDDRHGGAVGRALRLPLLAAHLIAVLVPLLHTWSHGTEAAHHGPPAGVVIDGEHHEIHPGALHDHWVMVDRAPPDAFLPSPVPPFGVVPAREIELLHARRTSHLGSRAPPGGDVARSPPSA